jgi:hypothetical protein
VAHVALGHIGSATEHVSLTSTEKQAPPTHRSNTPNSATTHQGLCSRKASHSKGLLRRSACSTCGMTGSLQGRGPGLLTSTWAATPRGREGTEMKPESDWVCVPRRHVAPELLTPHLQLCDGDRHGWQPTNQQLANLI